MGEWAVIVKDTDANQETGSFTDWRLNLWGEAIDGSNQPLHPLPDEHDDDHPYEVAHVATTSVKPGPVKTDSPPTTRPADHIDRPVNQKPGATAVADKATTATTTSIGSATASPTTTEVPDNHLFSHLPTFGASKRTQIWIYASLAMIIVFFIGLGVYFQLQRLKRRRTTPHDDYEFEMIDDEDEAMPMTGMRTQRRGGELYNAFAGESDEDVFTDDDEPYRDHRLASVQEKDDEEGEASQSTRLLSEKHY